MARRMSKSKKIQPAVMKLNFLIQDAKGDNIPVGEFRTRYLDLSQVTSLVNRRFYRQGLNWAVSNFQIQTDKSCGVVIQKLPNTWVMGNAWEKGFRVWQRMNKEATMESPSIRPKFMDFKIFADTVHHQQGFADNLLPQNLNYDDIAQTLVRNTATKGEWDHSTYEIPSSTVPGDSITRDIVAVGQNYASAGASGDFAVSLIEGYAASRALPNIEDPNMPADAASALGSNAENWQVALFNEGTSQDDEILTDLIEQNNKAPYPFEGADAFTVDTQYPGGANQLPGLETHAIHAVTGTTIGSSTNLPGGNFPCGLVAITVANQETSTAISVGLEVTLVPGTHRGYLAEPMTEM